MRVVFLPYVAEFRVRLSAQCQSFNLFSPVCAGSPMAEAHCYRNELEGRLSDDALNDACGSSAQLGSEAPQVSSQTGRFKDAASLHCKLLRVWDACCSPAFQEAAAHLAKPGLEGIAAAWQAVRVRGRLACCGRPGKKHVQCVAACGCSSPPQQSRAVPSMESRLRH